MSTVKVVAISLAAAVVAIAVVFNVTVLRDALTGGGTKAA
jgi:hypothetical protein